MTALSETKFVRPLVYVTPIDFVRLCDVVKGATRGEGGFGLLREELGRMSIALEDRPRAFAQLGSRVAYKDLRTKRVLSVRIVPPTEADAEENRISVLSPIGAALIGLPTGAIFRWINGDGSTRAVKVLEVDA